MKLIVLKNKLYKGCLLASKIISSKTNLPILSHLSFTASEETGLLIESSNLELSIRLSIPAKVEIAGQITVPARKFTEYLGSLTDEKVTLEVSHKQITVTSSQTEARFVTMPSEDFPMIPKINTASGQMIILATQLHQLVKQVVFAATTSDIHPILSGVLFDTQNENTTIVATDSFRLSISDIAMGVDSSFIIPASALTEVDRLINDSFWEESDEKVREVVIKLSRDDNQVFFNIGNVELISRLLEVEYPDYQKVIPVTHTTKIVTNLAELIQTIRRTAIFASRDGQAIKISFKPSDKSIVLTAQSVEVGSQTSSIEASIEGDELTLGFNHRYLLEGLESFATPEITILGNGKDAPVVFIGNEKEAYRHIVMPMSLSDEEVL